MKVLDLNEVINEVYSQLDETEWSLTDWVGRTLAATTVTNIYVTNDVCRGFGQDYKELEVSIISSPYRISLIMFDGATMVKSDETICGYESLKEDIHSILVNIQACFDRLDT